jgi:hypothetical protein
VASHGNQMVGVSNPLICTPWRQRPFSDGVKPLVRPAMLSARMKAPLGWPLGQQAPHLAHVVTSMSPRLDSQWGGSFPLPRREFHPLEASGLS